MEQHLSPERIRELAKTLDDAIESRKMLRRMIADD